MAEIKILNNEIVSVETGKLGIGTTTPGEKLVVANSSTQYLSYNSNGNLELYTPENASGYVRIGAAYLLNGIYGSEGLNYIIEPAYSHTFRSQSSALMTITGGGNVGIGITSPDRELDVVGVVQAQGFFISSRTSSSTNLATNNGGNLSLFNGDSTDGNFSNVSGYNSNSLVTSQINFINISHTNRTGAITFNTHNGSSMPERMRIDSSGNVGIGTTSPTVNKLQVEGSTDGLGIAIKNTGTGGRTYGIQSTGGTSGYGQGKLAFVDESVGARMVIDSSGNVGIGTTDPDAKLSLYHATDDVSINVNTGTGGSYPKKTGISFGATSTSLGGDSEFKGGAGIQAINTASNNNPTDLAFWTTSGGSPAERMRIDSSGNVGIGTTDPGEKLDVVGTIRSTGNEGKIKINSTATNGKQYEFISIDTGNLGLYDGTAYRFWVRGNGNVGIGTTNPGSVLQVKDSQDSSFDSGIGITRSNSSQTGYINMVGGAMNINAPSGLPIKIRDGGTTNVTISGDGNVGIGTTAPSAKLDIYGDSNSADNMIELINSKYDSTNTAGETGILFGWNNHVAARIAAFKEGTVNRTGFKIVGEAGFNVATTIATFRSTGRVGIGTDNPSSNLDVLGNTRLGPDSEHALQVTDDSTNNFLVLSSTQRTTPSAARDIKFRSYGTDATDNVLVMDMSAGNVGIGTASPAYKLDVNGTARISSDIALGAFNEITGVANDNLIIAVDKDNLSGGSSIDFQLDGPTSALFINNSRNIGIGTTNPSAKLHAKSSGNGTYILRGMSSTGTDLGGLYQSTAGDGEIYLKTSAVVTNVRISSNNVSYFNGGNVGIGTTTPSQKLEVNGASSYPDIRISATGLTSRYMEFGMDSAVQHSIGAFGTGSYLTFKTAGTDKVVIDATGNVGIGTTSPGAPLDVQPASDYKITKVGDDRTSHYKFTGATNHTLTLSSGSYHSSEVVITAHQTNSGTNNNIYIRGIWTNNHTSHHWHEIEHIGILAGSAFTITNGQSGGTANSGELEIVHNYTSGSFGQMVVRVTDHYGTHSYTIS
jgi:hypothetical protein